MRSLVSKLLAASIVLLAALVWVPGAAAVPAVNGIFPLATEVEANNKIALGSDGDMWVTLDDPTHVEDVAKITPSGQVQEFELPGVTEEAWGIAAGPEGRFWVPTTNKVTGFYPFDPKGTEQTFSNSFINGEAEIVAGPDGQMWVASRNGFVHFSPSDPTGGTLVNYTGSFWPTDIDVAGNDIVVADRAEGGEQPRVDVFSTAGTETQFEIPGMPEGVAGSPSGQIAYTAPGAVPAKAGLISPPTVSPPFELSGEPFGVTYGPDQAFWIVQSAAGGLTRLTTTGQTSFLGGLPTESAHQIAAGPGSTLWVTLSKKAGLVPVSAIARVNGVELPVTTPPVTTPITVTAKPVPDTKLVKAPKKVIKIAGGKATVKFTFSSTVAGSTFQCKLLKVPTGKKKKAPKGAFTSCRSPKALHLAPGKYRFAVRAVASGVTDPSPAERAFKVVRTPRRR